jgi:hypothetical protein
MILCFEVGGWLIGGVGGVGVGEGGIGG